jgi:RHS repeat-associated protein
MTLLKNDIKYLPALIPLVICLLCSAAAWSQVTPQALYSGSTVNYTRTWSATAPESNAANLVTRPVTDVRQSTQYFDGFGRPVQMVAKQASPLGNDLVTANCYDPATGNEIYKYLPFVANSTRTGDVPNDGNFKVDRFQEQVAFYNSYLNGQPNETNVGGGLNWAYSQTNYEASPSRRVLSSLAPGTNWVGSASGAAPHAVKQASLVNTATDNVQSWNIAAGQGSIPTSGGAYPAGRLYKSIRTDEQGRQSIEYKDMFGQVVLKKLQNSATPDNGLGSAHAGWLCTYYVYDDYGNLRFIIPPALVQQIDGTWTISQAAADELCYRYEYDLLDRMVIKKTPGTPSGSQGEVWMVYDVRNRLVMTQDGNMRAGSQWLCFLYDAVDRPTLTGTITYSGTLPQIQQAVTTQTSNGGAGSLPATLDLTSPMTSGDQKATQSITLDPNFSTQDGGVFIAEIIPASVTGTGFAAPANDYPLPTGVTIAPLTVAFYDNYNWLAATGSGLSASLDQTNTSNTGYFLTTFNSLPSYAVPVTQSGQVQGLPTGTMTKVLGAGAQSLYSEAIYDDHGRTIQTQSTNISGGKDIVTSQYSWDGKVLRSLVSHSKNGSNPQTHLVSSAMNYDAMGRLLNVTKLVSSVFNGTAVSTTSTTIAADQYNELGQLNQKTLGNNLETLAYDYNVRGWLLGVNRAYAKSTATGPNYFGFDLGFDQGVIATSGGSQIGSYASPAFNGNVAGTLWKSRGDNQQRKYDYTYDIANRLTAADFNQQSTSGAGFDKSAGVDFSVSNLTFDGNGNIRTMNQNGWLPGGSQPIDNLVYTYLSNNNSNRLMNVVDNSPYNTSNPGSALGDFHYAGSKTAATSVDYGYDADGNITSDFNRSISSISYNYLDLPQQITIGNKGNIQLIYDAGGNKLQKITTETNASISFNGTAYPTSITTTTTYIGTFVYKSVSYGNLALASLQYTDRLQFIAHEDGRVRPLYNNAATPDIPTGFAFDYFIRDQVGNVRIVLTDEQQQDIYPAATLETGSVATEQTYYNISNDAAHVIPVSALTWWPSPSGTYPDNNGIANPGNPNPNATSTQVYRLNGQTGDKYGLGIAIKVMAGDKVSIFAKSIWHNTGVSPGSFPISSVLSSFINVFAGSPAVVSGGHNLITGATLNGATATTGPLTNLLNGTSGQPNPTIAPKAAINWILFNDQFVPVSMGTDLVSSSGDVLKSHSQLNLPMAANGYLYVYCSNESDIDVYFDNLQVVNTRGPLLEETHYYPAGLAMAGISDRAWNKLLNFYHYQADEMESQEFSDGTGLEEYDFHARYYDQQLGVWHTPDPAAQYASPYMAMGNSWPNGMDPDGKNFWTTVADIGLIGGAIVAGVFTGGVAWFAIAAGGYAGASMESGGHWNPLKWNDKSWEGALTGEILTGAAIVGGADVYAEMGASGENATAASILNLSAQATSIANGAVVGIVQNVGAAYLQNANHFTFNDLFTSTLAGAISGAFQSNAMQSFVDNDIFGLGTGGVDGIPYKAFDGPFQGVLSNIAGAGISGVVKDAANGNAGWNGIGPDVFTGMVASGGGQIIHNVLPQNWGGEHSPWAAILPNFGSAATQQVVTGLGNNIMHLAGSSPFANVGDGMGGTVWSDALGNGVGGQLSDWLYPWP